VKQTGILTFIVISAVFISLVTPFIGMESTPLGTVFRPGSDTVQADIFWKIRLPRTLTAFFAGAALALSGMAFQALFRNPLATPFTLGVSSGASLGAAIYLRAGILFSFIGISGQSVFSFVGAVSAILFVYGMTRVKKGFSTATMLLAGVAASFFFSSMILFMQYISDFTNSFRILRWLMGGLEIVGYRPVMNILPFVLVGSVIVSFLTHELNLMITGEDIAISRGVNVRRVRSLLFFAVSLMVGGVVSVCGPIGFVGMMSPHICRLLVGPDHRYLIPASFMFGGAFLTICDTISRTLIAPAEIPVGIITALLGGPFFLWLLLSGTTERGILGR